MPRSRWPRSWDCAITPGGAAGGGSSQQEAVRCAVQPARLLGSNLTYRFGTHDASNTLYPFGYGLSYHLRGISMATEILD
jgi:hypothetical protein